MISSAARGGILGTGNQAGAHLVDAVSCNLPAIRGQDDKAGNGLNAEPGGQRRLSRSVTERQCKPRHVA